MRTLFATAIVVCGLPLSAAESPRSPVDLESIPRTITAEPDYATDSPQYCLAVFGTHADQRVWLVRDGDRLFVDRNGDGALHEAPVALNKYRYFDINELHLQKYSQRYTSFRVYPLQGGTYRIRLKIKDRGLQYVGAMSSTRPKFADSAIAAPIVHFDGRMTLGQYGQLQTLPRYSEGKSYRVTSLKLMVGTPGLGEGTFAAFHCKCRRNKTLKGSIEFPTGGNAPLRVGIDYQMRG